MGPVIQVDFFRNPRVRQFLDVINTTLDENDLKDFYEAIDNPLLYDMLDDELKDFVNEYLYLIAGRS